MHKAWDEILRGFGDVFAEREENCSCAEWNERYRFLPTGAPFKCWPWQVEVLNCVDDPEVGEVVLQMASQTVGKSEMLLGILCYKIAVTVGDYLLVMPTLGQAERWSRTRWGGTVKHSPLLKMLLPGEGGRTLGASGSKLLFKQFQNGSTLAICGANSASALASSTIRALFFDETDLAARELVGIGSPFINAARRLTSFSDSFLCEASSPTIAGESKIAEDYDRSDQRVWSIPCPACGVGFTLDFSCVIWDIESGKPRPETARVRCPGCHGEFDDSVRRIMTLNGRWQPLNPVQKRVRGYKMSAFYALQPTRRGYVSRLHEMVQEYLLAAGDPLTLQPWKNQVACECFEREVLKPVSYEYLLERRENFFNSGDEPSPATHSLPEPVLALTAAVDVQAARLESLVIGWARGRTCWVLDHKIWLGNVAQPHVWTLMSEYLGQSWSAPGWKTEGKRLAPELVFVDAGFLSPVVYQFCDGRSRTLPSKGVGSNMMPLTEPAPDKRHRLQIVRTDCAKQLLYERLRIHDRGTDAYIHLHSLTTEDFCRQVTSEVAVRDPRSGQLRFRLSKEQSNEALDLLVLNLAAEYALRVPYDRLEAERRGLAVLPPEELKTNALSPRPAPKPRPRRPSIWGRGGIGNV